MRVEILGLPGAGKSTFVANVLQANPIISKQLFSRNDWGELQRRGMINLFNKLKFFTIQRKKNQPFTQLAEDMIDKSGLNQNAKTRMRSWLKADLKFYSECDEEKKIYLYDEGFVQRLLAYGAKRTISTEEIAAYLKIVPAMDLYIISQAEVDQIVDSRSRESDPASQFLNLKSDNERKDYLAHINSLLENITQELQRAGKEFIMISRKGLTDNLKQRLEEKLLSS